MKWHLGAIIGDKAKEELAHSVWLRSIGESI